MSSCQGLSQSLKPRSIRKGFSRLQDLGLSARESPRRMWKRYCSDFGVHSNSCVAESLNLSFQSIVCRIASFIPSGPDQLTSSSLVFFIITLRYYTPQSQVLTIKVLRVWRAHFQEPAPLERKPQLTDLRLLHATPTQISGGSKK